MKHAPGSMGILNIFRNFAFKLHRYAFSIQQGKEYAGITYT